MDDAGGDGRGEGWHDNAEHDGKQPNATRALVRMADRDDSRLEGNDDGRGLAQGYEGRVFERNGSIDGMADAANERRERRRSSEKGDKPGAFERLERLRVTGGTGPTNGFWRNADWLGCRDGKWRPVRPGSFPLAYGAPARVGRLRGYGNAINAQQAKIFAETVIEILKP
jgi:DNA (cytosine-5)-methyltransferase 1